MKILFCSYAYPNAGQPQLATFNRAMLAGLSREHAVRVVAPVPFLQRWRSTPDRGAAQVVPGVIAEYPAFYYPPKVLYQHYDRYLWWSIHEVLQKTIEEFSPDVILSYWAHPDGTVAVRAAREAGIPAVVMVGGSDVLVLGRAGRRRTRILQTLHDADRVIAVSEHIAKTMRADGIAPEKISVVPRGVDRQVFYPGDRNAARKELGLPLDTTILVGVGRLVPVKDWTCWIEACHQMVQRGRKVECYILGSGPLERQLSQQIDSLGLSSRVFLAGSQPQSRLVQWYRAADLTLLSSVSEGVPNVLLETIACGGSFVATKVGGIPEIADPDHDRLVPAECPTILGLAAIDRLEHPPPRGMPRQFQPDSLEDASRRLTRVLEAAVFGNSLGGSSDRTTTRLSRTVSGNSSGESSRISVPVVLQ